MIRNPGSQFLRVICSVLAAAAALSCVHRPRVAETGTESRETAMRLCESALRLRFSRMDLRNWDYGAIATEGRVESQEPAIRIRAFIALTPGRNGWAAEVTVLRERLDDDRASLVNSSARWVSDGRDSEMENLLVDAIENAGRAPAPVFTDAASAPASRATSLR